jgi:phosphatidylethanolamine/phosphatidyl-N-methylethanolamine N-methyltransferase
MRQYSPPVVKDASKNNSFEISGYRHFFIAALLKQVQTGAILPSQRFLIRKMISAVPCDYRGEVIELGAGNGAFTLRLAARCPHATIIACEINSNLAHCNRRNVAAAGLNSRVEVIAGSAEDLLSEPGRPKVDYIISGVPIGNLGRQKALNLVNAIRDSLTPDGTYVQFQHFIADYKKIRAMFSRVRIAPVLLNIPPAVVYYAQP